MTKEDRRWVIRGLKMLRDSGYFEPSLNWPELEFDDRCTELWALDEAIRRVERFCGDEPYVIITDFLFELLDFRQKAETEYRERMFYVASRTMEDVLDYLHAADI